MPHLVGAVLRSIEGRPWNDTAFPVEHPWSDAGTLIQDVPTAPLFGSCFGLALGGGRLYVG
jgi:hypothetical protein